MDIRQWLPPQLHTKKRRTYMYATQFLPATASVTTSTEIQTKSDSYFLILAANAVVTDTSDATIVAAANAFDKFTYPFLVTLSDSASGDPISNIGVAFDTLFGNARDSFPWPSPWLLDPSAVIRTQIENLLATDRRIRIAYCGVRIMSEKIQGI
jgi:hypothetical protein